MLTGHTMSLISDLWALQEIDVSLDAHRASLEDAESRLDETDELVAARDHAATLDAALHRARSAQRDLERAADDVRAKIGPLEAKLYGGSIRNPKELAGLQADIDQLKRQISAIEDRDLDALAAVEAEEAEARSAATERDTIEAAWTDEQDELRARVARLRGEIADEETRRREQAACVSPDVLKMYDRLRIAHSGRALARLDRNLCTGCRISLPTNLVTRARGGSALAQCPNCERILVA
ncbi:MAG: zinc ribbon domain-containing protein [Dehalococcoidia bacterium]